MRGDVYRLRAPRDAQGHEQDGPRYAVVVQADYMLMSTWLVAPTSMSARPTDFRPEIVVEDGTYGTTTKVLVEQTSAVDPEKRLGKQVGHLTLTEMASVDTALRLVLGL